MSLLIIFTLFVYFLQLFARFTFNFSFFAQFLLAFCWFVFILVYGFLPKLYLWFLSILLLYWKLFAFTLFMVFTVFKVFQSICTFAIFFFNTRTVFGVALLRLPYFKFCSVSSLPGTFEFTMSGIFDSDTICLVKFPTLGTSIGFFALLFGVFASFHWFRFQVFAAPLVKLTGTSMGSPLAPIIHMYPYQFKYVNIIAFIICLQYT